MATVTLAGQTARRETKLSAAATCSTVVGTGHKIRGAKLWLPTTWCQNIILPVVLPNIHIPSEHQVFSDSFLKFAKFTFESQLRILWHLLLHTSPRIVMTTPQTWRQLHSTILLVRINYPAIGWNPQCLTVSIGGKMRTSSSRIWPFDFLHWN